MSISNSRAKYSALLGLILGFNNLAWASQPAGDPEIFMGEDQPSIWISASQDLPVEEPHPPAEPHPSKRVPGTVSGAAAVTPVFVLQNPSLNRYFGSPSLIGGCSAVPSYPTQDAFIQKMRQINGLLRSEFGYQPSMFDLFFNRMVPYESWIHFKSKGGALPAFCHNIIGASTTGEICRAYLGLPYNASHQDIVACLISYKVVLGLKAQSEPALKHYYDFLMQNLISLGGKYVSPHVQ